MSTDQNIATIKGFHEAAKNGGEGFVKFSKKAWEDWDKAIGDFIDKIDTQIKPKFSEIRSTYKENVSGYISAQDTRKLVRDTAPDEVEQAVNKYRDYLVELRAGIKAAYDRLNNVDQA